MQGTLAREYSFLVNPIQAHRFCRSAFQRPEISGSRSKTREHLTGKNPLKSEQCSASLLSRPQSGRPDKSPWRFATSELFGWNSQTAR
jgi:hypothetical protein